MSKERSAKVILFSDLDIYYHTNVEVQWPITKGSDWWSLDVGSEASSDITSVYWAQEPFSFTRLLQGVVVNPAMLFHHYFLCIHSLQLHLAAHQRSNSVPSRRGNYTSWKLEEQAPMSQHGSRRLFSSFFTSTPITTTRNINNNNNDFNNKGEENHIDSQNKILHGNVVYNIS